MTHRAYIIDDLLVVEWTIIDPDGPAPGATVTGSVALPDGNAATMSVTADGNVFRASHKLTQAGRHAYKLTSTSPTGAIDGEIRVPRTKVGLPPIAVDPTTTIGRLRMLAADLDETDPVFEDNQYEGFYAIEGENLKRAAALAIETIALNEALIGKVIRTGDGLQTDAAKLADALMRRAKSLRDQADREDDAYGIDIVTFDPHAAYRC